MDKIFFRRSKFSVAFQIIFIVLIIKSSEINSSPIYKDLILFHTLKVSGNMKMSEEILGHVLWHECSIDLKLQESFTQ